MPVGQKVRSECQHCSHNIKKVCEHQNGGSSGSIQLHRSPTSLQGNVFPHFLCLKASKDLEGVKRRNSYPAVLNRPYADQSLNFPSLNFSTG